MFADGNLSAISRAAFSSLQAPNLDPRQQQAARGKPEVFDCSCSAALLRWLWAPCAAAAVDWK